MTTQGHTAAMRHCIAQSCEGGRVCRTPLTCSASTGLVDDSIQQFQLHRLQRVEPTTAYRLDRPLAPGVVEGPSEPDEFTKKNNALTACARWFLVALLAWVALYVAAGYIAAFYRLL